MVSFYSLKIKQVYKLQKMPRKLPRNFWVNKAKMPILQNVQNM